MITSLPETFHYEVPVAGPNGAHRPDAPTAEEVRRQLQRILDSKDFVASERNRRFLAHVVERTLRGETVRGYEIGTQVFGRPGSFNATGDPIVRIEAGKLRRDLETYYLKSGRNDPIRITLPKGAYRTTFSRNEARGAVDAVPQGALMILRAALLGLAGEEHEATAAWRLVEREYPDFALDRQAHKALEAAHAFNERVRELLLEGLQRAARPEADCPSGRRAAAFAQMA